MDEKSELMYSFEIIVSQDAAIAAATYLDDCGWNILQCICETGDGECGCIDEALATLTQALAIAMKVQTIETMGSEVVSASSKAVH